MKEIKNKLTKKQQAFYRHIEDYFHDHGETPTISELKEMTGFKSLRTITQYLDTLGRKGLIYRRPNQKRGIEIISMTETVKPFPVSIPVVASAGCDNAAVFAEERVDEYVTIDREFIPSGKNISDMVAVRAVGESMREAGIENGDLVLVEKLQAGQAQEKDRVVALIGDKLVIKRLHFSENAAILEPESKSKAYKPIYMKDEFIIPGRVVDVIRTNPIEPEIEYIPIKE